MLRRPQLSRLPRSLLGAAGIAVVLGVAWLIIGGIELSATRASRLIVGGGSSIVMLAYGLGYLAIAYGLLCASRFARGPAIAMALVQVPIAWSFLSAPEGGSVPSWALGVGVALGLASLTLVILTVLPATTQALFADPDSNAT